MKASAWIAMLALTLESLGQGPFPMSNPVIGCCPAFVGTSYAVADFNGDGRDDFAAVNGYQLGCTLTISSGGYGAGTLITSWSMTTPFTSKVHGATDLTGDGNADILYSTFSWSTGSSTTFVCPGNGAGQFGTSVNVPDPTAPGLHLAFVNPSLPGIGPAIVLCSTHSGSGLPTLIDVHTIAYQSGAYSVISSVAVTAPPPLPSGGSFQFWHAGDVNGDGLLDLVGNGTSNFLQWDWVLLLGTATPPYFGSPLFVSAQFGLAANFELADVNNDGMDDVVARKPGASITNLYQAIDMAVYFGHPTTPLSTVTVSVTGVASTEFNLVEDVDGDGNRDLMMSIAPPPGAPLAWPIAFSRGDGQGHFGPALPLQSPPAPSNSHNIAADADGDGFKDVVGFAPPGTFVLYNQSRMGPGLPGAGGAVPQTTVGVATPGNPAYHVGVVGGAPNATAFLGVSLGLLPTGSLLDPATLLLPTPQFGAFTTDSSGSAAWWLSLPPAPALLGQTVYLQWAVIDAGALYGYSLTPARKIVFW